MIFCFSGTGNSRYIARRFAEALQDTIIDLNAKIKAQDNSLIQTGQDVIIVVPTYAWRIPRVVSEWLTASDIYGNGTSCYAGELYCYVWCTKGR